MITNCNFVQIEYKFHIPLEKRYGRLPVNLAEWCWSLDYGNYAEHAKWFFASRFETLNAAIRDTVRSRTIGVYFLDIGCDYRSLQQWLESSIVGWIGFG